MNRREFSRNMVALGLGHAFLQSSLHAMPPATGFKFSVMLWTLERQAPFDRCLEIVSQAGYTGVELVGEPDKWSSEDMRRIMKKMSALGLVFDSMTGGNVTLADPSASAAILQQVTHRIGIAKTLGCRQLILTSGKRVEGLSPEAQFAAVVNNVKQVGDLVAKNQMELVIEPIDLNENKFAYLNSVTQAFKIVHAVGSPSVKVLYDFYHEQQAGGDLIHKLEQNIDQVGLVHVADVPGRHDPGTGEIDYTNIYRTLARLKYDHYIAMEFYPVGDPVTALRTARLAAIQAESA
jgi:hydroxypyruvate isomerase